MIKFVFSSSLGAFMADFFYNYGLFLIKIITILVALIILISFIAALKSKGKQKGKLTINKLNDKFTDFKETLAHEAFSKKELKSFAKKQKAMAKNKEQNRIFVLEFKGDIKASAVQSLREEITAILSVATKKDEIIALIESTGGMIPHYGLAASQLKRIRDLHIPLTAIIDKTAASGGYMMACVADKILAAPFAIIGSIGVVAQLPNFNKLLKKHDIDYEQIMGGKYKRTLSLFGENTEEGRKKFQEEVNEAHELFKTFVLEHRPNIDINTLATGEYWYGSKALQLGLIDRIITSDDYLLKASDNSALYEIKYCLPRKKFDKIAANIKTKLTELFSNNPLNL